MLSDITHLPSGWKPRCRPALGRRSSTHQCCHAWSSDPPPAQERTVGCQWGWEESSMAPGMHLRETEKEQGEDNWLQHHRFFCVFLKSMHSEGQKLKAAEGMLLNFSLFFSWILFLESILFVFSAPHNFFFFLSLLIFNFHSFCLISPFPFSQRGSDVGRAAGTHRKQVTSSHAYVKKWRGTMVTKPFKAVEDGSAMES